MELLDGGDLRERSPLPWRQACELLFDVCSSLALLHSRRLVHRDITPRNVRCTQTGSAKLIDFGAMAPMGASGQIVGTPGFMAPEVLQRASLDGRTDLYSLGATLYFALTGRAPYAARRLSDMLPAWRSPPPAPSLFVPDIPPELDRLAPVDDEPRAGAAAARRLRGHAAPARARGHRARRVLQRERRPTWPRPAWSDARSRCSRSSAGCSARCAAMAAACCSRPSRASGARGCSTRSRSRPNCSARPPCAPSADSFAHGESFATARALCEQLLDAHPDAALRCAREVGAIGVLFEEPRPAQAALGRTRPARAALLSAGAGGSTQAAEPARAVAAAREPASTRC